MDQQFDVLDGTENTWWMLWAKWQTQERTASFHPLICHMVDVACVVECLWKSSLPEQWKLALANDLALEPQIARQWLMFLAGMHDIGKASPGFQTQLQGSNRTIVQRLLQLGGFRGQQLAWVPHALVSAIVIRDHYQQTSLDDATLAAIAMMLGGHHGIFPSMNAIIHPSDGAGMALHPKGKWHQARTEILASFCAIMGIPPLLLPGKPLSAAAAMRMAGVISVADWIASSTRDFPLLIDDAALLIEDDARPQPVEMAGYVTRARQQARAALQRMGWLGWRAPAAPATFTALFPTLLSPRDLQQQVIEIAPALTSPALVVIEAPMGEGKTEAALFLADRWCALDGGRGLFFALPTQATSTSMFTRVHEFLKQRFPADMVALNLLHGHAALSQTLRDLQAEGQRLLTASTIYDDDDQAITGDEAQTPGAVIATEWFASNKRALLAPFGVGTIDQGLMAALSVKHGFVRHLGLSTKTVVIDEVHSYDVYMTTLLKRLLEWLGAHQVPVVLLSATLPCQRRQELLSAYASGAQWPQPTDPPASAPYPRVSWVTAAGMADRAIQAKPRPTVQIQRIPRADPAEPDADARDAQTLLPMLRDALGAGGCIAVICNTVARTQAIFHALQAAFEHDPDLSLDLFHARFPYETRAEIEQRIITHFGKEGPRPPRAILVATQVVEQSLDLDFDLMVTDLAPVDLILQRLGRLHRHERPSEQLAARPQPLARPRCVLFMPGTRDERPAFAYADSHIYDKHVLLRTWLLLRERDHLDLPGDIEAAIEAVYGSDSEPADLSPALQRYWHHTQKAMRRKFDNDEKWAKDRYIHDPHAPVHLDHIMGTTLTEDHPEIHPARQALTRNAAPSITVICLSGTADHPRLHPDSDSPPVDLTHTPDFAATRNLLMRSVTLSRRNLVNYLRETPAPASWQKTSLLRHCRPLFFDDTGTAQVGPHTLRLDPHLGIIYDPPRSPHPNPVPDTSSD